MNERDILKLVLEMRKAQNKYFRTRTYADLDNSKIIERQVDNALKIYFNNDGQTKLDL